MSVVSTPTRELQAASTERAIPIYTPPAAIERDIRRTRRWMAACGVIAGLVATWAIWPQSHAVQPIAVTNLAGPINTVPPLDLSAFDAPMWTLAALPHPPPPPPAPPPALVEQLLAVSLTETDAPTAMFYRPSEDRIVTVHVGDSIGGRTVKAIAADKVTLVWKAGTKTELIESLFTDPRNAPGAAGGSP